MIILSGSAPERGRERFQGDMTAPPNCLNFTVQTRRRANVASYK